MESDGLVLEPDYPDIPEPLNVDGADRLPEWYMDAGGKPVRRCVPFLRSMRSGLVFRVPDDVIVYSSGGDLDFEQTKPVASDEVFSGGSPLGERCSHTIFRLQSFWTIESAPDSHYLLITRPLNRSLPGSSRLFDCTSGMIDLGSYRGMINMIAVWTGGDGEFLLEQGTPILQATPVREDTINCDVELRYGG